MESKNKTLSQKEESELFELLKNRFQSNMNRHQKIKWEDVQERLLSKPDKIWSLNQMEVTDGEPDVVGFDKATGEFIFYDCSKETPKKRRNICYDKEALESRKTYKPKTSAMDVAHSMGIDILSEEEYRKLQELGEFDTKTSSWVKTPNEIRKLGGALFCDRRYNSVFTYHNGASSYYGVRGFRGVLKI